MPELTRGELNQLMRDKIKLAIDKLQQCLDDDAQFEAFVCGFAIYNDDELKTVGGGDIITSSQLLTAIWNTIGQTDTAEIIDERN